MHIRPSLGQNPATHGSYRGRPGTPLAVLALHNFALPARGRTYQAWVNHNGEWISMGTTDIDAAGNGLVVSEGPGFATLPSEVEVTVEPRGGSPAPTGAAVIHYQRQ